jgi:hypothetical protein
MIWLVAEGAYVTVVVRLGIEPILNNGGFESGGLVEAR